MTSAITDAVKKRQLQIRIYCIYIYIYKFVRVQRDIRWVQCTSIYDAVSETYVRENYRYTCCIRRVCTYADKHNNNDNILYNIARVCMGTIGFPI